VRVKPLCHLSTYSVNVANVLPWRNAFCAGQSGDCCLITIERINGFHYFLRVILSFACDETERVFGAELSRRFPPTIQRTARRKLLALHAASELREMAVPPGNRLEALKSGRKGQHSIRINDQWRICFHWREGNAYNVEIVDYH